MLLKIKAILVSGTAQFRTTVWSSKEFDAAGGNFSLIVLNFLEPVIIARQIDEFPSGNKNK
jgi:hypothetical protein